MSFPALSSIRVTFICHVSSGIVPPTYSLPELLAAVTGLTLGRRILRLGLTGVASEPDSGHVSLVVLCSSWHMALEDAPCQTVLPLEYRP